MTDALETQLQHELREVADDASVPPVDVDALLERGRQGLRARRRRTGLMIVTAAASVCVVVAGVTLVHSYVDTGPGTGKGGQVATQPPPTRPITIGPLPRPGPGPGVASLPHGPAPKLAYWAHGVLHWPGGQARIPYPQLAIGGDRVLVQFQARPGSDFTERLLDGGRLVALPVKTAAGAVISPNGQFVAWQVLDGKQTQIVVWRDGRQQASLELPVESACCSGLVPALRGIDDAGRVYVAPGSGWTMWDALGTGKVQHLSEPTRSAFVAGATAFGPVFLGNSGTVYGRISGDRFVEMGRLPAKESIWSTDGQMVAWARFSKLGYGGVFVRDLATGTSSRLPLPRDVTVVEQGWESDAALLVSVTSNGPKPRWYVLRCAVAATSCQVAADLGPASHRGFGVQLAR